MGDFELSKRSALRKSREIVDSLEPGEEFFPLMGRDHGTPDAIRMWAHIWQIEIKMGARPESDREQIREGLAMASRMEIRLRDQDQRREHLGTEFGPPNPADGSRTPINGQHARLAKNTTSGANDHA